MPKLKSNRGAMKRFKKTGKGGFKHRAAYRNHILTKMSTKRKRHLRGMDMIADADKSSLKQMMPFV
ncbi:50S ribosomal protein L35 [Thiotrichales bacterium 19S11-10]|nr:50S ribosomal protein L35 [Thiotrichales bacterium 19S11-10]MCF6808270.1 50S ribosomal protein L35 [Thiotrichales bacterium 19S9-11]MCF6812286.1 50S ribosomal protein L35 [Thiotrichales bacterium 19S9-12]